MEEDTHTEDAIDRVLQFFNSLGDLEAFFSHCNTKISPNLRYHFRVNKHFIKIQTQKKLKYENNFLNY